jgi:O-antigen/teichoic acid export membrane protein
MFNQKFKKGSFFRNFTVLMSGEALAHAFNMVINIILARKLAPDSYGLYALFLTYVTLFFTFSTFGLRRIVIRCIARDQDSSKKYFVISLVLRFYGVILSSIGFIVYNKINPVFDDNYIVLMILAGVFLQSYWEGFQNVAFGMERMETTSYINVGMSFILLLTYLCMDSSLITVKLIIGIYIINFFAKDCLYLFSLFKQRLIKGVYRYEKSEFRLLQKNMLTDSMPYYILNIFSLVSTQLPILFLNSNSSITEVSYFNIANKLLLPMTLFIHSALVALFPNQAKEFVRNQQRFTTKASLMLYFISVASTGNVLTLQCWYMILFSMFGFIGNTLGAADKQKWIASLSIFYACVNAPLLWYCSKNGAIGLSYGYIVGALLNMTYHIYYLQKAMPVKIPTRTFICFFGVMLSGFIFSIVIPETISIFLRCIIVLVIFVILFLYRGRLLAILKNHE